MSRPELLILGGGVAGGVAACAFAAEGRAVTLLTQERRHPTYEGLSPRAAEGLRTAGCERALEAAGPWVERISHWNGETRTVNGETVAGALGTARYRDRQPQPPQGLGPVRLMCEIIDYRYARTLSGASQMIDPYIHRGLWRDVQIWLPAVEYRREEGNLENLRAPTTLPLVVKIFPMMTWLWLGLLLALAGAIAAMRHEFKRV
ncbi:MAG: hypothetical protein QF670_03975 [Alphaproteobacteria bacterium]|jgi:hypothetical protein|nr:hypothetical protein [Alphaproteobacteria bacterium]MEE1545442.1 hypothetical protein [Alphaproteobacteria bacterium]